MEAVSVQVSPDAAIKSTTERQTFTFLYTAVGNIGSLKIALPSPNTGWDTFKSPENTTNTGSNGRISVSQGDIFRPAGDAESNDIVIHNLGLTPGDTVSITYDGVQVDPSVREHSFRVDSASSATVTPSVLVDNAVVSVGEFEWQWKGQRREWRY